MLIAPKESKAQMLILYELLQRALGAVGGLRVLKAGEPLATHQCRRWALGIIEVVFKEAKLMCFKQKMHILPITQQ